MLTQDQIESYHTDGYITVARVVSAEEVAELRRVTDHFVDQSRQATDHTDQFDLEPGHSPETPRLRRLKLPESLHPAYDRVFRDETIIGMVAQLVGPAVRHFGGKLNMKSAEFGSPVEWHQDFAFAPRANDAMLAVGVAIDDMTPENGCLLVVPGSHRGPIYNHYQDDVFVGGVTDPDFEPGNVVHVELAAGDISIHHGRTLHASAPNNTSGSPRRFYLLQYCAADAWRISGDPPDGDMDAFNAMMMRGDPPAEPRHVETPPVPKPDEPRIGLSGSIYESQAMLKRRLFDEATSDT